MRDPKSVVVIGGGTMGVAAAWALGRQGVRVTVLERFSHVHSYGSHGGFTRIIRQAYHEGEHYVPLVRRADDLWVDLGARVGKPLLVRTGLLEMGPSDDASFGESIAACQAHGVELRWLEARDVRDTWPFEIPDTWRAILTPSGGYLHVEACLDALRDEARATGASFRYGALVREVDVERRTAVLDDGERVQGDRLVVAAGAWLPQLMPAVFTTQLTVRRRVQTWWEPRATLLDRWRALPVWTAFDPEGFFYGFPYGSDPHGGLKIARHVANPMDVEPAVNPNDVDRALHDDDLEPVRRFIHARMPHADGRVVNHCVCMYTTTPSWDFVVDRHPDHESVVLAGGFSGHGFKFAPAIGELVAALCQREDFVTPGKFALARL